MGGLKRQADRTGGDEGQRGGAGGGGSRSPPSCLKTVTLVRLPVRREGDGRENFEEVSAVFILFSLPNFPGERVFVERAPMKGRGREWFCGGVASVVFLPSLYSDQSTARGEEDGGARGEGVKGE